MAAIFPALITALTADIPARSVAPDSAGGAPPRTPGAMDEGSTLPPVTPWARIGFGLIGLGR
eukprot:4686176-Pyramimonas_sp.AAC.1